VRALPNGEAVRVTFDGRNQRPQRSASGRWFSFIKEQGIAELWVVRADGSETHQIGAGVGRDAYAWSPVEEVGEAKGRNLRLVLPAAPWPLPPVQGDPDLLFLAVHNLVSNALKFSKHGDLIEVRGNEQGNSVLIEVADTGCGVPDEEAPHVWDELYRGQAAHGTPGSGLGLALVRAVVERHHGEVALRSRIGQGSVFTVRLPTH
jgi:signal transduction histidine kinase